MPDSNITKRALAAALKELMETKPFSKISVSAFRCAIKRWLLDKNCMPAKQFTGLLKNCLLRTSGSILQKLTTSPESAGE